MALATRWSSGSYSVGMARRLAGALGISPATAALLVRRGYESPELARRFLAADERHDPLALAGRDACELILRHVEQRSRVVIHGDYDVDGVCATAVLMRGLGRLGLEARWHLPAREEGYGLSREAVARLAREGVDLLITVDCGITAADEVASAVALGLDVVVTDHHLPDGRLPDCPIVHPGHAGYPFVELCGTAVAHKLVEALLATAGVDPAAADEDLDLVALATVADVVSLRGENRRLVREGLARLRSTHKPGLRALTRVAGCDPGALDEHAIGFRLAPRLNAAGRLARADAALELVTCDDEARADEIAAELDLLNRERQDTETRILFAAEAARAEHPDGAAYVLAADGWHPGVIGIVAGRLVERYHRPCVVIALDGDSGRGSGRSIAAYDLHAGLAACAQTLRRFGGHRAAAGLEVDRASVPAFRAALCEHAASVLGAEDLVPVQAVDAVVSACDIGVPLAEELERLRPFGHGNPKPSLLVPAVKLRDLRSMGDEGQHVRCRIVGATGQARAVAFRTSARTLEAAAHQRNDVVVSLELNEWRGAVEPRLVLRALCDGVADELTVLGEGDFWADFARELAEPLERTVPRPVARPREVCDRREGGFAGVAVDLLSSGEGVLIACADVARRRDALAQIVGGVRPHGARWQPLALASWEALARDPALAEPYVHIAALDPPACAEERAAAEHAPCAAQDGYLHLAWGAAEVGFARALAAETLDVRDELRALYRELRAHDRCAGAELRSLLEGNGRRARRPALAARLMRILEELGLVELERAGAESSCQLLAAGPRDLGASPTYRRSRERFEAARGYIDGCLRLAA